MKTTNLAALVALLALSGCYFSQSSARRDQAAVRGAWAYDKIDATDWSDGIKARCKEREVLPGMTKEQVEAAFGKPDEQLDVNGKDVWVFDKYDLSAWDGTYIPQRAVRFDDEQLVLSVSTSG